MVIRIHAGTYLGERGAPVLEPPQTPKNDKFRARAPPKNAKYLKDLLGINIKIDQNIEQNEKLPKYS